uniref:hypothetical protein n=1 Tax=Thermoplasma acidophilum TaxID=2303 RepID=UPI0034E0C18E
MILFFSFSLSLSSVEICDGFLFASLIKSLAWLNRVIPAVASVEGGGSGGSLNSDSE